MKRSICWALGILIILVLIGSIYVMFRKPTNTANWSPDQANQSTVITNEDGTVTITNVRNWIYNSSEVASTSWESVRVNPSEIKQVWFISEPFSAIKFIGHTFLSFEFNDGTTLSFSIEARRVVGQKYSAFFGLFRNYGLNYTWGTERDFITRRLVYLKHPLRMYPLTASPKVGKLLFTQLVADTNTLATHPRFYNTLTANCTNELAKIVNQAIPDALPYDVSWNLTGIADLYLMKKGYIKEINDSSDETRDHYDLTSFRTNVESIATSSPAEFSAKLRSLLPKP